MIKIDDSSKHYMPFVVNTFRKLKIEMQRKFEYKCRRCGKIDSSLGGGSKHVHGHLMDYYVNDGEFTLPTNGFPITKISICSCDDGGQGVGDFIGISPEKP